MTSAVTLVLRPFLGGSEAAVITREVVNLHPHVTEDRMRLFAHKREFGLAAWTLSWPRPGSLGAATLKGGDPCFKRGQPFGQANYDFPSGNLFQEFDYV